MRQSHKFMTGTFNLYADDGRTRQRRDENTSKGVSQGHSITRGERRESEKNVEVPKAFEIEFGEADFFLDDMHGMRIKRVKGN